MCEDSPAICDPDLAGPRELVQWLLRMSETADAVDAVVTSTEEPAKTSICQLTTDKPVVTTADRSKLTMPQPPNSTM